MKSNKLSNVKIGKRIVVGTYAFPLNPSEKKRYGSMTHRWVCLLRSIDDENMTHYIKRVQFELDPSFLNPKRVLTSMPYEVTEVGWGEFFIGVKITFVDESLEPIQLQHLLRLNPSDGSNVITTAVNETFDEIVFNEPKEWFYERLVKSSCDKLPPSKYRDYFWNYEQKEKETMCRYICSQSYFQNETYRLLAEASELCKMIQQLQEQYHLGNQKSPPVLNRDKPFNKFNPLVGPGGPAHLGPGMVPQPGLPFMAKEGLGDMGGNKLVMQPQPGGHYMDSKLESQESNHSFKTLTQTDRESIFSDRSQHSTRSSK